MPEPPSTTLITRYVLENPWPPAIILLALAAFLAWSGFREGLAQRQKVSAILAIVAAAVLAIGYFVVTSGERAKAVAKNLVQAVVAEDLVSADNLLAENVALAIAKPTNPGIGKDLIMKGLEQFTRRFTIESNSITLLKAYSESSTSGTVHLGCMTTAEGYPNISQWVVRVDRQNDGRWKVAHLTFISLNNQPPPGDF